MLKRIIGTKYYYTIGMHLKNLIFLRKIRRLVNGSPQVCRRNIILWLVT